MGKGGNRRKKKSHDHRSEFGANRVQKPARKKFLVGLLEGGKRPAPKKKVGVLKKGAAGKANREVKRRPVGGKKGRQA